MTVTTTVTTVVTAVTRAATREEIVIVTNTIMASMGTPTTATLLIISTTFLRAAGAMFGGARTDIALMMRAPTLTSAVMDIGIGVDLRTDTRVQKIERPGLRLE